MRIPSILAAFAVASPGQAAFGSQDVKVKADGGLEEDGIRALQDMSVAALEGGGYWNQAGGWTPGGDEPGGDWDGGSGGRSAKEGKGKNSKGGGGKWRSKKEGKSGYYDDDWEGSWGGPSCTIESLLGTFAFPIDPYVLLYDEYDHDKAFVRSNLQTPATLTFGPPMNKDTGFRLPGQNPPADGKGVMQVDFCHTYCGEVHANVENCGYSYGQMTAVQTGFVKNGILPFVIRPARCWQGGNNLPADYDPTCSSGCRDPLLQKNRDMARRCCDACEDWYGPNGQFPCCDPWSIRGEGEGEGKDKAKSGDVTAKEDGGVAPLAFYGEYDCKSGTLMVGAADVVELGTGFSISEPARRYMPHEMPIVYPGCIDPKAGFKFGKDQGSWQGGGSWQGPPTWTPVGPDCQDGCGFRRRMLKDEEAINVKEDLPIDEVLAIIDATERFGARPDASFEFEYNLISKESCDALVKYADSSLEADLASGNDIPMGKASDGMEDVEDSWLSFKDGGVDNQYSKKIHADDLVTLIGREEALRVVDFWERSFPGLDIDCMYIGRHGAPKENLFVSPWHVDPYLTVEITLNDDYEGGHVLHMNADGVHKTQARLGSAIAHKNDIIHGITPNTGGAKYMLILKNHPNRPDKKGVVRISRDIVNKITSSDAAEFSS